VVGRQNADIPDNLYLRDVATAQIFVEFDGLATWCLIV